MASSRVQEGETDTLDADIEDARPALDPLAMEQARMRTKHALFGRAEPAQVGRYTIIERIAGGGMGVVYRAYDPELDRSVALKVLHPQHSHDDRARRRLATEARTLAKLDHPNVVKVHDVLTIGQQIVIVMEFVGGKTLAAWQAEGDRDWRETVALYVQAADGLVAAHGVDVIHRDFKPSNAILGVGDRVRVLDFGLARLAQSDDIQPPIVSATDVTATQTGDILGTLGYASPEQLRGERLTAASDQFSFCVSLHYALEGVNPFSGDTVRARLDSMSAGKLALGPVDRSIPAWLRGIIARGLALEPSQRFATIADLALELRRPRGLRRWRLPFLLVAIAGASVAITLGFRGDDRGKTPLLECDGGHAEITAVWNPQVRGKVSAVLADEPALAQLDRYAASWSDTHRTACNDHRRGATSPNLFDRRMTCLNQRLGDFAAALEVVTHMDSSSIYSAMDVVARVPAASRCSDLERLKADIAPPDSTIREQVIAARARISTAEALARAGRSGDALRVATEATANARLVGYAPVEIEAALAESRILISQRQLRAAIEPLKRARNKGLGLRMYAAAIEASARLLYVEGMVAGDPDSIERDIAILLPLAEGRECDHFVRPLLFNNIGAAYLAIGRRDEAIKYFRRAKADIGSYAPIDLELTVVDRNLAMLTPDNEERSALAASVWSRLREALGEFHPSTLEALVSYAEYVADPATAYDLMARASDAYHHYHPTLSRETALADLARALLARELGERNRMIADYQRAIASSRDSSDADVAIAHRLAVGELAVLRADTSTASTELVAVSEARLRSGLWYERVDGLRAEVDRGLMAVMQADHEAAIRHFETALAGYPSILAVNEEVSYRRLVARARLELAAILSRRGQLARAHELVDQATAFYRSAGPISYRWLLDSAGAR